MKGSTKRKKTKSIILTMLWLLGDDYASLSRKILLKLKEEKGK